MTSRTLAKRLLALAKRPKTLANVTLAKSLVGEITRYPLNWSVVKQSLVKNCISSSGRVIWKEEVPYKNYLQFHRVSLFNLCKMDSPQAQKLSIHKQFIFPGLSLPFVNLCKISRGTWSCERHFGHLRCLVNVLWMYHFLMIFAMSKGKSVFKVNNETWKNDLCDRIGFRIASENYYP